MRILLVDTHRATQIAVAKTFTDYELEIVTDAGTAILAANSNTPDLVMLELSLRGHSGMEFLYEFRTYSDWATIPVIIYSTILIDSTVQKSKAWKSLGVDTYLYKPETSLELLKNTVEKVCRVREAA